MNNLSLDTPTQSVVIDYIDLQDPPNRKKVYKELLNALMKDRAKVSLSEFSNFGLLEMTRQRIGLSLLHTVKEECNVCNGSGWINSNETLLTQIENWFKRLVYKNIYNDETKSCEIGHEYNQEVVLAMKEYCEDILKWISDMQYSTVLSTDQKMNLILSSFFSEYKAKSTSNRVTIKEKLNASEKNQFKELVLDGKNLKLLNIMSNICYKKINKKEQKGLGVFMDILFRSCEQ